MIQGCGSLEVSLGCSHQTHLCSCGAPYFPSHCFHIFFVLFLCACIHICMCEGENFFFHVFSLSFCNFSCNFYTFPLTALCTYSRLSVIFLRHWHPELTMLPLADQSKYYGPITFLYLDTIVLKLS